MYAPVPYRQSPYAVYTKGYSWVLNGHLFTLANYNSLRQKTTDAALTLMQNIPIEPTKANQPF